MSVNASNSVSNNSAAFAQAVLPLNHAIPRLVGAELMMIHDAAATVVSFYWHAHEDVVAQEMSPVAIAQYISQIQHVLTHQTPHQFRWLFQWGEQTLLFDLVMSPVLFPIGSATLVVVTGEQVQSFAGLQASSVSDGQDVPLVQSDILSSNRYHRLLTKIAWNVRRTLDLSTIWQQTVTGLGSALGVSRCILCPYEAPSQTVQVVAEYCQENLESLLNTKFLLKDEPDLSQALARLQPIRTLAPTLDDCAQPECEEVLQTRLAVATHYLEQPNGLIIVYQCDRERRWTQDEIEFMQELADQVGTAIAHATLFTESQALATELQRVNADLRQKHRELEEARHQAEAASHLKSEFLANTSHELRTPLNGMIGFLKLILDGMAEDPEEQREFLEEAHRSAMHLLDVISDVLDIAKIEAGKMQIELSPVTLDEVLTQLENMTQTQIRQKFLSLEIQQPPTHDEIILYGNYQRLLQVLLNLVGNAIKFTHEGGITISAEVIKKRVVVQNQDLPGLVKIRVADTGIGVSLDKQDKLFQSFSQVDGSMTRQYGGTGLGLAISQKLVEAMGGVVNFYSMGEGLGSTVTFTIPLYQEPVMITT
ncbi:GAF domain-containing protein [Myxacorys almedinensis A]|uniref:Circadian input-output histidine kinase CikA n=2 Tax=Myxacorys TaxID=2056239 RepID=A0A8J7Z282_9CYAN|nr:GAF domain-containing protein [Myxacorys almedinensis A]